MGLTLWDELALYAAVFLMVLLGAWVLVRITCRDTAVAPGKEE